VGSIEKMIELEADVIIDFFEAIRPHLDCSSGSRLEHQVRATSSIPSTNIWEVDILPEYNGTAPKQQQHRSDGHPS